MKDQSNLIQSYSQLLEDIFVHRNYINIPRKDIVLVEVGAFDGKTYSNTLMLEEILNCKPAYLVEPSPPLIFKIKSNRPKSHVLQLAVGSKYGVAEFRGDKAVSGLIDNLSEDYIKRWGVDDFEIFKVITAPFSDVEAVMGFDYIDFLSVDIQGGELDLLSTLDKSISIGVICIELEGQHIVKEEQCRQILRNNGFIFSARLLISEIWHNPKYDRKNLIFDFEKRSNLDRYSFSEYSLKHLPKILPTLSN